MVQLRIAKQDSATSAVIELSAVYNYLSGKRQIYSFAVRLNPSTNHYEVTDLRNGRIVSDILVETRYSMGFPIGISNLQAL